MNPAEIRGSLEAIIYAADEPATVEQMAKAIGVEKHELRPVLDELVASYAADERGVEIREVAGGFKFYTKPQFHDPVRRFIKGLQPPLRLTMSALETLAVIAYKQPVTQPEIQEIRGVNSSGVLQTLLEKRLITTAGRKAVIGRPILYRTSRDFLMRFGLSDVGELPSLKEFEALARQALGTDEGIAPIEPGEAVQPGELAQPIAAEAEVAPAAEIAASAADGASIGEIPASADMGAMPEIPASEQALEMAVNEPPMAEVAAPIAAAAAVGSASKPAVAQEGSSTSAEEPSESADGAS
jgi:segregation and condensation protein B